MHRVVHARPRLNLHINYFPHLPYISLTDQTTNIVLVVNASTRGTYTLVSGLGAPRGAVPDCAGNVWIADCTNNAVKVRKLGRMPRMTPLSLLAFAVLEPHNGHHHARRRRPPELPQGRRH